MENDLANNPFVVDCDCGWYYCTKRVSKSTYYRHRLLYTLRQHNPPQYNDVPMPVESAFDMHDDSGSDAESDADSPPPPQQEDIFTNAAPTWNDPVFPVDGEKPPDIILGELLMLYFEWMSAHKTTDACSKDAVKMMSQLLPADANGIKWQGAQRLLQAIYDRSVVAVDLCPNDCIAFYDCKHPKMAHYKHAKRTWCPHCGADRRLTHKDGTVRTAKTGYYLPCGTWFTDLLKMPDMASELDRDTASERPDGHASKSRGWKQKVNNVQIMLTQLHIMLTYIHEINNI